MELLKATCSEGHTWDVWADDDRHVKRKDLRCPSCFDDGTIQYAIQIEEPESLA